MDRKGDEKMNSKIMLVSIAVLAVGLFAMPSTVSLIAGQHAFIAYNGSATTTSCESCHGAVTVTGPHSNTTKANNGSYWNTASNATDKTVDCRGCHVPGAVNTSLKIPLNNSGSNLTNVSNTTAHVAVRAQCTVCHDTAYAGLTGPGPDAHKPLNDSAINTLTNLSLILPSDRACIVCHTWAGVSGLELSALTEKGNFTTNVSRWANGSWNVTYNNRS